MKTKYTKKQIQELNERKKMKTKYTKKQIQESIKHWQKILKENFNNSLLSMNDLIEFLNEDDCDFNKPIFINPDRHYNQDVCKMFLENCIKKYGSDATLNDINKLYDTGDDLDMTDPINLYCSLGQRPKMQKIKGDQVIVCDLPEDGISYMD